MSFTTLVLGIGNTLLTDEGIGVYVIRYLAQRYPHLPDVDYMDGGTLSFTLAEPIAAADGLITVDAARLDAPPGSVRRFEGEEMDRFLQGKRSSVHEVSLADLLDMARLTGDLPERRCLIGIQPSAMGWGDQPTPEVEAAIPEAAKLVLDTLFRWTGNTPPPS